MGALLTFLKAITLRSCSSLVFPQTWTISTNANVSSTDSSSKTLSYEYIIWSHLHINFFTLQQWINSFDQKYSKPLPLTLVLRSCTSIGRWLSTTILKRVFLQFLLPRPPGDIASIAAAALDACNHKKHFALINNISADIYQLISECVDYDSSIAVLDAAYVRPTSKSIVNINSWHQNKGQDHQSMPSNKSSNT